MEVFGGQDRHSKAKVALRACFNGRVKGSIDVSLTENENTREEGNANDGNILAAKWIQNVPEQRL
jgi:hypothetical protein